MSVKKISEKKHLNKEQLAAVKHKKGPLLIIAGAGTGKTTVITERIKFLILSKLANPSEVLALTFTEKAAREMEERVDVGLPYGYTQMWISTFHSFCDRVLRQEALHIGLDPTYKLMTEAESIQLIRQNLFEFDLNYFRPLGNPTKFVGGLLQHFSRLQDEDISPEEYIAWVKAKGKDKSGEKLEIDKWRELAEAYKTYEELKIREGVMDFGSLITKTLKLFRERPNVLRQYKKQFKYILVDEFQDTNIAQNELIKLLAGRNGNITVVADDDQSIYKWRGAAVSNVLQFKKTFPSAKIVTLNLNYRSAQEILDKAYKLIQHNNPDRLEVVEKIDKKLVSVRDRDKKPTNTQNEVGFIHADRVENEADAVAKKVLELVKRKEVDYKDVAVLVRANNHAEPFIRAFQRHGIPYQFLGPGRLFKQPEVVGLVSYLKVLYNFEDSVALYRVLSHEYFDISARDLAAIGNYARRFNLSLFQACEEVDNIYVSKDTREKIKKIIGIINRHLKLIRRETAGQILYYFLQDTGLLQNLLNPDTPWAQRKAANISKFFDKLKSYEVNHEDATVPAVVDWIELSSELGESPLATDTEWMENNAVNILTVHSSKGLEFPVVFLVNLVSHRFPSIERREQIPIPEELIKEVLPTGDYHIQEERRLFYVGMTRARDILFFTAADYYGEGKREKKLSPFIFEALGEEAVASEQIGTSAEQLSFLDYDPAKSQQIFSQKRIPVHVDYLSYSQIETFKTCPLHYKLKYLLGIPTPPTSSQSFGTSIHTALKDFYLLVKKGEKPNQKLILKALKQSWISEGYATKVHEKKSFEKAKRFLLDYFEKEFNEKRLPDLLEQSFVVPLVFSGGKINARLKIGGKIDRVDRLPGGKIEIIDYKTGANIPTQREVDHDFQLTLYALAAVEIKEKPFGKKPEEVVLSLYYFDNQKKISTQRTIEDLSKAKEEILKIKEEIEKSDFTCSGRYLCRNCEYKLFCQTQE